MTRWILAGLAAAGAAAAVTRADSIWERRDPRYGFLFQDVRARGVGDIVTVEVSEATTSNEQDARNLDKRSRTNSLFNFSGSTSASSGGGGGGGGGGAGRQGAMNFNFNSDNRRQFNGNAQLTMNRVFTDRISATVVDVMPNGNLVIEGYRSRVVAGEERVLRITGVVRQQDVTIGNVVPSGAVANFRVSYLGRGVESRTVNQGYWNRALNILWPW